MLEENAIKIVITRLVRIFVCITLNLTILGGNERYESQLLNDTKIISKESINEILQAI